MKKKRNSAWHGKMRMKKAALWIAVNAVVIALILLLSQINILQYPAPGMKTRSTEINFAWTGMSSVQIDENPDFTSPLMITSQHPAASLEPGTYYWKAGFSEVRSFVIDSEIVLAVTPAVLADKPAARIQNQGNTPILLGILNAMTGRVVLEPQAVSYEENVSSSDKIVAEEYHE